MAVGVDVGGRVPFGRRYSSGSQWMLCHQQLLTCAITVVSSVRSVTTEFSDRDHSAPLDATGKIAVGGFVGWLARRGFFAPRREPC